MRPKDSCRGASLVFVLASAVLLACGHNDPTPATAGAAGASTPGAATTASGKECPLEYTVDDCEDGTNQVKVHKGRNGYWYTFIDRPGPRSRRRRITRSSCRRAA
jgi:hypothetical protein